MSGTQENQMFGFVQNASQLILTKEEHRKFLERQRSKLKRSKPGAKEKATAYARRYRAAHPEYLKNRLACNLTPEKLERSRFLARKYQKTRCAKGIEHSAKVKEKIEKRRKEYRASNPDRRIAWQKVSNSVAYERLHSPLFCQHCGNNVRLHAHHLDYSKPLEVKWLCPLCHCAIHRGEIAA